MIVGKVSIVCGKELFNELISELSIGAIDTIRKWPNGDFIILYTDGVIDLNVGHDTDVIEVVVYTSDFRNLSVFIDHIINVIEKNGVKTEDCVDISIHDT